ncbi:MULTISPECIES: GGDEF domain-containing protein [unclassified Rhodococcus (in: high G+C Gram-positive bacteria)]|uniref:GGDEF domain-containing protein n=1 Tax=unclassified Rhodococcus (in: high G+C Gram-positive bacteria) TaxID=192944 RepID=UPI001FF8B68E|nr:MULTISPECIES: GGDEF domain-containing protein [unclassified Rhodococcus (in: high G+C Gram-positive bacteria)]
MWSCPGGTGWTAPDQRSIALPSPVRIALSTWCWLFAALCVLATFSPAGVPDGIGRYLAFGLAGVGSAIGLVWLRGPWPTKNYSRLFVAYLELFTAAALLMLTDPFVALPCAAGFAVNGGYIAAFHSPKLIVSHQLWAGVIVGVLFVRAVIEPGADVVLACAYLVLLILMLFSAPVLSYVLMVVLRRDASQAFFDPLTGLRNRRGLVAAIAELGDQVGVATVMVVDLDAFKAVNDRHGHAHGDLVLRAAANAIHEAFDFPAVTSRTGGEEFAVVTHLDPVEALEQAYALQSRFTEGSGVGVTVSIGVAHADAATLGAMFDSVYTRADIAMYAAKRAGGNTLHRFDGGAHTADGMAVPADGIALD